jgi:hypothetical protein
MAAKEGPKAKKDYSHWLTDHEEDIMALHDEGTKSLDIARHLVNKYNLPARAITAKAVSDWLNYHKKSKKKRTYSVSQAHGNLPVDLTDNCMFSLLDTDNNKGMMMLLGLQASILPLLPFLKCQRREMKPPCLLTKLYFYLREL